jgi:AcrR family transcriptional regulator
MSARTVDWRRPDESGTAGLRERKKRLMRQQLTDTATIMFLERGFDAVRVSEIAEACGVSEKTVFNYFPSKESLILDHPESTMITLRTELARPDRTPTAAALAILADELDALVGWLGAQPDLATAVGTMRDFNALISSTPSLRAHRRDMIDQLVSVAAETLAARTGRTGDDPLCQITATALLGLWSVQFAALRRHLDGARTLSKVHRDVTADVHAAAQLIDTGLAAFDALAH